MPHPSCILHADMDAFYASVEQRDHPELRGRPVAVGGDGRRGVVSAASYEARRFGVHSAMPGFEARRLCPDLVFVRGDMALYARESRRIFAIFREFSPAVEGLSLDEAFLDLTGTQRLLGPPGDVGRRLRERVAQEVGLAVSVGIAPVKMAAKIASDLAKPDGLLEVGADELRDFLGPLPVRRIWGVGPVAEKKLLAAGLRTIGDVARSDPDRLQKRFGDWGERLVRLARGEDVRDVEPSRDAVSYSEENTFERDVRSVEVLDATLMTHAESVARRLRRDGVMARTVVLKWCGARRAKPGPRGYPVRTRRTTLPEPTDDGELMTQHVRALLRKAELAEPVRLIGVGVTNLVNAADVQLGLFESSEVRRRRVSLNRAMDRINDQYGARSIRRASQSKAERAALSLQIKRGSADDELD